jgi:CubicO group peptidase (beta-lactamase class C family)
MTRRGVRVLVLLGLIASCAAPKPSPTPTGHDAAFDCAAIQGPLSRDRFYEDNPTYTDPVDDSASWTLSTPRARGMDPDRLERASAALAGLPYSWSFLVIRHDALVFERYYHGSARNQSNNVHSASKSIWGAAIGIAVDEGLIPGVDATVASTLPPRYGTVMGPETRTVRVRDLLTMTSGSRWDEDTTETEIERTPDWVAATLRLPRAAAPGTRFNYSTGDSHLGSAVLTAATETTACEFVHQRLLAPLGVVAEHWGRDPQGYFSGGYNFYVTPRELAKFGLLYLHGGRWHGRQLVPAEWVETSMTEQVDAGAPYGYGYDFWLRDLAGHQVAMAWGYGGQMVYIVRDLDLVVVLTTNTRDFAPDSFDGSTIVENDVLAAAH